MLALKPDRAQFLVIDVQEKLCSVMEPSLGARTLENLARLGGGAAALGVPAVISEQYPKGLGPTVEPVKNAFAGVRPLEKLDFSACADPALRQAILGSGRRQVLVAGMETHICVFQTVRALTELGLEVAVLRDAVASRTRENYETGLELCERAGALLTSTEAVLFDLVGRAGGDAFKTVSRLVR